MVDLMCDGPCRRRPSAYSTVLLGWLGITLLLSCAPAHAYLRLHPENPHYFQETRTGRAVLVASHGCIAPSSSGIDYKAEIKANSAGGTRYVRVWHFLPWEYSRAIWPWGRSSVDGACMGGSKLDMNTWDPVYWRRLRDSLARCGKAGIYAEIFLFEGCGMEEAERRWHNNPWASDNNINSLDVPGGGGSGVPDFYYFDSRPNLRRQQERYLQKMVDETISYPNVIYELENEHDNSANEPRWTEHYSRFVKDYIGARYPGSPRLLSQTSDFDTCFNTPSVDIVNYHSDSMDLHRYNEFLEGNWHRNKAMNVDELANGETSYDALRRVCWTIVTSGGHFHVEDARPSARPYDIVRNILSFVSKSGWGFVHSAPNRKLIGSGDGCCMANPGREYVAYFPSGGDVSVRLEVGQYRVRWWNPRTGGFSSSVILRHAGGDWRSRTPDESDWVLQVRREATRQ